MTELLGSRYNQPESRHKNDPVNTPINSVSFVFTLLVDSIATLI